MWSSILTQESYHYTLSYELTQSTRVKHGTAIRSLLVHPGPPATSLLDTPAYTLGQCEQGLTRPYH